MKDIPLNLLIEKNKLFTSSAWVVLLYVVFPVTSGTDDLYLTNNNEDVVFEGVTYYKSRITLSTQKKSGKSKLSSIQVGISNVDRLMQQKVEQYNGANGATVTLTIVNTSYLDPTTADIDKYAELQTTYDVIDCVADEQFVIFTLGAPSPMQIRVPFFSYSPVYCEWEYKGVLCKYTGAEPSGETTCNLTLSDCKLRNNQTRFGAHIGMNTKAYSFRFT